MAGPKGSSSLPAKKPKVEATKPATATNPSLLSAEFVEDSDESGDARIPSVKKQASDAARPKPKPKSTKPAAASKPSISLAKSSKKRKSPSPSPAKDGANGSESEDDESSQDEEGPAKKKLLVAQDGSPTPKPKPVAVRPIPAKRSIKPSTNVKPLGGNTQRGSGATANESSNKAGGSSEGGSSGNESGSGSESESGSSDKTSLQSPRKKSPIQTSASQQSTSIYEPPAGFKSTSISVHPASQLSEILAPPNLQGKQIWHITAPESIPISLVKEVSTHNIGNGASILEYQGAKYGLVTESETEQASSRALLLPSTQTNNYRPSKSTIVKTLHLQQLVSLPNLALEPAVHPDRSVSASQSYRKTPRQQPEGLRMRYRPFGVSDDSDLEPSSEPIPKVPEFRTPAPVKETSPRRKRKRLEFNNSSSNISSAAKSKRQKQNPKATAGAVEDPIDIDAVSDKRSNVAESPAKSPHPETNGVNSNHNLTIGKETKEERKRRRQKEKIEHRESPSKPGTALPLDLQQHVEKMQPGEVVERVPAIANAVNGTTRLDDDLSPPKESKEEETKRREARRRQKELERASRGASSISAERPSQQELPDSRDPMMQEIETAQREASIRIPTPRPSSPRNQSLVALESRNSTLDPSHSSQRKETKEERAKRREEKRRRRMERGSA
ncbi:MAG: hypothetical protein ALECFALPRED_008109 [Alectoria fallacina]|uniref:Uncharacterized protein n=1 Tax=Alectoria fallacina TaxID=1903189 RepID=A0A8H3ETL7_9LECA|nr:MAG: hypothetical protein ALECFALPRED_008109 [Alectoria fallacina]